MRGAIAENIFGLFSAQGRGRAAVTSTARVVPSIGPCPNRDSSASATLPVLKSAWIVRLDRAPQHRVGQTIIPASRAEAARLGSETLSNSISVNPAATRSDRICWSSW